MRSGFAVFETVDMYTSGFEANLIPAQTDRLKSQVKSGLLLAYVG
jgi:hypothetical protein